MNKKYTHLYTYLLISLFLSILVFSYLTYHHYSLVLGYSSGSLCQISSTINCDGAALSSYSEVLGIPVALLGLCFSIVMLGVVFALRKQWLELTPFIGTTLLITFAVAAFVSILLGGISLFVIKIACPFCFISYVLSFINLALAWMLFRPQLKLFSLVDYNQHYGLLGALIFIPFISWFVSTSIQEKYGLDQIRKIVPEKILQWQQMPVQTFDTSLGLIKGDLNSKNVLIEFADFKCPHCKVASQTLSKFSSTPKDLKIVFKPFPLDGNCNPHVSHKGDSSRCQMASFTLCSEKINQKGWIVHDYFFAKQEELMTVADIKPDFQTFAEKNGLSFSQIIQCADSVETYDALKKMADEANKANVQGTPTIYLNNKKLDAGQFLDVLNAAYKSL